MVCSLLKLMLSIIYMCYVLVCENEKKLFFLTFDNILLYNIFSSF